MTDTKELIQRLRGDAYSLPSDGPWIERDGSTLPNNSCSQAADALEAMSKDAERYRWLRENPSWIGWDEDFLPTHVDAAIDAAIAKESP